MASRPQLEGRTALVTGAAGGLGKYIARALHGCGATVKLSGSREHRLEELRDELGSRAEVLVADLSKEGQAADLARRAGAVDILVANAAIPGSGPLISPDEDLPDYTIRQVDRVIDVNLRAPIHLTRELLPGMLERGYGKLIYISSLAGKTPTVGAPLYSATKFGLRGFTLALYQDLRETPVSVSTIYPGLVKDAGMLEETGIELPRSARVVGLATPGQVADAVLKAIEKEKLEVSVARPQQRSGGWLTGLAPRLVASVMRRGGSEAISREMARQQLRLRDPH